MKKKEKQCEKRNINRLVLVILQYLEKYVWRIRIEYTQYCIQKGVFMLFALNAKVLYQRL